MGGHLVRSRKKKLRATVPCAAFRLSERYVPVSRQVAQEYLDFFAAHEIRMALPMKNDEATNSVDISLFRPVAVVAEAYCLAHFVEQARGLSHDGMGNRALTG